MVVDSLRSYYRKYGAVGLLTRIVEKVLFGLLSERTVKRWLSHSQLLTALYYYGRGTYYHEQRAVLRGHATYLANEAGGEQPIHRRIRLTHQLEKGISKAEPIRRDVFGEAKVETLLTDLQRAWERAEDPTADDSLLWSVDVVARYFEVTGSSDRIEAAEQRFEGFLASVDYEPNGRYPKPRSERERSTVSYEQFAALAQQRSSTRQFRDEAVPRSLLDDAVEVALQSPSSCNRQSFEFRVYDDPEMIEAIHEFRYQPDGPVPVVVVLVGKQRAYSHDQERNVIFIDASLAAMSFQYALETLGLASCTVNWPMIPGNQRDIAALLDLDPDEQVITLMQVGYPDPDGMIPHSNKKSVETVRSYNRWSDA